MSDTSYSSPEDAHSRLVRFREGDDIVEYAQVGNNPPSVSPPLSTPSPSISHTTDSSEAPLTPSPSHRLPLGSHIDSLPVDGDAPIMSEELLASFQQPWNLFHDTRDGFWDDFNATVNNVKQITLYIESLPSPITVEHPDSSRPILVGDVYRAILDYLKITISDNDQEYSRLDGKTKAKVMQKFLFRKAKSPDSRLQRSDFLLERQVFRRIVPFLGGEAWKVQFLEN